MHTSKTPHPVSGSHPSAESAFLSQIYGFLALTMRFPNSGFCDNQFLDAYENLLDSLAWQEDLATLKKWRETTANILDDLQIEYTRLFINGAPRAAIPPYASVYVDGDGCIQGKTTEKIKDFYRQCGYAVTESLEPPDHIQHELEFLAALAKEGKKEEEFYFLRTYFRPWFESFYHQSIHEARHPFYRVAIQLIDFFTKEEQ